MCWHSQPTRDLAEWIQTKRKCFTDFLLSVPLQLTSLNIEMIQLFIWNLFTVKFNSSKLDCGVNTLDVHSGVYISLWFSMKLTFIGTTVIFVPWEHTLYPGKSMSRSYSKMDYPVDALPLLKSTPCYSTSNSATDYRAVVVNLLRRKKVTF